MLVKTAVDRFLEGYFSTCQRSEKTIQAYTIDLRQFCAHVGSRARLARVRPDALEAWAAELKAAGYASASIRRKFATLKVFFGYWVRRGTLDSSPTWRIRLDLAPERRLPKVLTVDEVGRLLRQAKKELGRFPRRLSTSVDPKFLALRNLAIVEILFATGIRIGELASLDLQDIDLDERKLLISGKGGRQRVAFLPDNRSYSAVSNYLRHRQNLTNATPALFMNTESRKISSQSAAYIVTSIAKRAQITRKITPHMLRHTVATLLLQNGADIRVVQEFLGHTDISTTQKYTHINPSQVRLTVEAKHPSLINLSR